MKGILTIATIDRVIAILPDYFIGISTAINEVISGTGFKAVISGTAIDGVQKTVMGVDVIVAGSSVNHV